MNIKNIINKIGLITLPIIGGLLGAFGGSSDGDKAYRRFLIPALITSYAYSNTESILVITIMLMIFILSIGYGIPEENYKDITASDRGSFLGRFYYNLFNQNHNLADRATRGTIGLLIGLSLISIPIIKHNWIIYLINSLCIILVQFELSWRNLGSYKIFKKELSWVETITWGLITLFSIIIIYYGVGK